VKVKCICGTEMDMVYGKGHGQVANYAWHHESYACPKCGARSEVIWSWEKPKDSLDLKSRFGNETN
jgi:hypothetical protein